MPKERHILVIRLSAMGDVAMLVPVLQALFQQNKHIKVTILSRKFLKPIFDTKISGLQVNFIEMDTKGKHKGFLGIYRLYKELKKLHIDIIADTHNVLRSKILGLFFSFSGKKVVKIDKGRTEKKALTKSKNKIFKQLKTTHQRYVDVFKKLGFDLDLNLHKFNAKPNLPNNFSFTKFNGKQIGIAPFAQYQGKMYPLHLMKQVIEKLAKSNTVYLFGGGKEEVELLQNIADKHTNVKNLAGKLNLKEELQVIANLDVMLAMDSGNAHFAAMFNIKTVTIWGVTHPFAGFAPYKQQEHCLIPDLKQYPNLPCSIYGNKICKGYENVMETILVDTVVEKVLG